ncbi:MAG: hypothetical protein IT293_11915 [Deltaproteobacteria bacterium]|nr:hypothetical protein [Deltaproteobacteria bacterium]
MGKRMMLGCGAVAAVVAAMAGPAHAQELGGTVNTLEPAVALIMPFDVSADRQSFQLASRVGGSDAGTLATHWSFWSESCDHLADVFICLTLRDTVVVDPTAVQGQIQVGQGNENTGPKINLTGEKGFVTVTAFDADPRSQTCEPADPETPSATPSLIGSWVVSNTQTNATFGNVAIGIVDGQTLPAGADFFPTGPVAAGMFLQTYDPLDLTDSEVFFIGVAFPAGNAQFAESEIGPIPSALVNGSAVCCNAQYYDNTESFVSLPDVCLTCSMSAKVSDNEPLVDIDLPVIIPRSVIADTSGFVRLSNCRVGSDEGDVPIGDTTINGVDLATFVFGYHGMAVGPYGTSTMGKYTAE